MEKVFIAKVIVGSYSDKNECSLVAFATKEKAEQFNHNLYHEFNDVKNAIAKNGFNKNSAPEFVVKFAKEYSFFFYDEKNFAIEDNDPAFFVEEVSFKE